MAGGMQAAREISHYADQAGLLQDPQLATRRMKNLLTVYGL